MAASWPPYLCFLLSVLLTLEPGLLPSTACSWATGVKLRMPPASAHMDTVTVEIRTKKTGSKTLSTDNVDICLMKDGAECFPMFFNDPAFELEKLLAELKRQVPGSDFTLRPLSTYPERAQAQVVELKEGKKYEFNTKFRGRFIELEDQIKGMFCKSGKCKLVKRGYLFEIDKFECQAGGPGTVPLNFADFQAKYERLRLDILNDKDTEKACAYVNRLSYWSGEKYFPGTGKIQRTKDSKVETVPICLMEPGTPCFPSSKDEEDRFKAHLKGEGGQALEIRRRYNPSRNNRRPPPPPPPPQWRKDLLDWNCKSGKCSGSGGKCESGTRDPDLVFKPYTKPKFSGAGCLGHYSGRLLTFRTLLFLLMTALA